MRATLFAAFIDNKEAEKAAGALLDHGLSKDDVSLIANSDPSYIQREVNIDIHEPARSDLPGISADEFGGVAPSDAGRVGMTSERAYGSATGAGNTMVGGSDPLATYPPGGTGMYTAGAATTKDIDNWAEVEVEEEVHEGDSFHDRGGLSAKTGISTTTPEDAGAGAVKGAAVGLGIGVLAALAAVFVPGVGIVAGAGVLATAMAGAAATAGAGAVAGGAVGWLKDQGIPADALTVYREAYDAGGAILAVNIPSDFNRADIEAILAKYGAQNIDLYGEIRS